jgi:hypothetical protein
MRPKVLAISVILFFSLMVNLSMASDKFDCKADNITYYVTSIGNPQNFNDTSWDTYAVQSSSSLTNFSMYITYSFNVSNILYFTEGKYSIKRVLSDSGSPPNMTIYCMASNGTWTLLDYSTGAGTGSNIRQPNISVSDCDFSGDNITFYMNGYTQSGAYIRLFNAEVNGSCVLVDTTPPTISISSPTNISYSSLPINLNVTSNEAASTCVYNLNGGSNTTLSNSSSTNWSKEITGITQGLKQLYVYCDDLFYNTGINNTVYFTYDTTPPIVTIYEPTAGLYGITRIPVKVDANELSTWTFQINSSTNITFTPNITINFGSDGTKVLDIYATDAANNVGHAQVIINIDVLCQPTLALPTPANGAMQHTSNVVFNMTLGQNYMVKNCSLNLNGVNYTSTTVNNRSDLCFQEFANRITACGGLSTGTYTLGGSWITGAGYEGYRTYDGDYSTWSWGSGIGTLTIEYPKPLGAVGVKWFKVSNTYTGNTTIPSSCFDYFPDKIRLYLESDRDWTYETHYYCWNGAWLPIAATGAALYEEAVWWTFASDSCYINETLTDGLYFYNMYVNDPYGNQNVTETRYLNISIPPTITIFSPTASNYNITVIPLSVGADKQVNTWWYQINGTGTNVTFTPNSTINFGSNGTKVLTVYANDSNSSIGFSQVTININTVEPEVFFVYPTPNNNDNIGNNYVFINVTSNSTLTSCTLNWNFAYQYNMTISSDSKSCYINVTGLANGLYWYYVTSNVNQSVQQNVTVAMAGFIPGSFWTSNTFMYVVIIPTLAILTLLIIISELGFVEAIKGESVQDRVRRYIYSALIVISILSIFAAFIVL